jgi:hypothetical protein
LSGIRRSLVSPSDQEERGGVALEERFTGSDDLWLASLPLDRGPEENLKLWKNAEAVLDGLSKAYEKFTAMSWEYEGAYVALVDAYNRCIEERRRCEDLLKLHKKWESRPIGAVEPKD